MSALFVVVRSRGVHWNHARPMEQQVDWSPHAAFMDGLASAGFVLLGGPVENTDDIVLIIRASSADEIEQRLSGDPWGPTMLATSHVGRWTLRLGKLI